MQTFLEFVQTETQNEPVFKKMSQSQIDSKGKSGETIETERFHVKHTDDGDFRTYTVHDKQTGEHVGTVFGAMKHKGKTFRVEEVTKDKTSNHPQMMHEVYHHILNHGTSLQSSGSISKKAHKVWETLHEKGSRPVRAVENGKIIENSKPDWNRYKQKSTLKNINNPITYFVKA